MIYPKLTKGQNQKLTEAGFKLLFDLVTYFPCKLLKVAPYGDYDNSELNFAVATLNSFKIEYRKRKFIVIDWEINGRIIKTYLFKFANYLPKQLEEGQQYLIYIVNNNGFVNLDKFTKITDNNQHIIPTSKHLLPVYSKMGILNNTFFTNCFARLSKEDFVLDLNGLFQENALIPSILDLSRIHRPKSIEEYQKTQKQWLATRVYLNIILNKYYTETRTKLLARVVKPNNILLKKLKNNLEFELTESQERTIDDIVRDLG